ncbi:MAG: carbon-nitrogen hydrolase family protein [Moraxellaceae bacterium]|jgi:nitrilase|nr:carbon-nitrogen hydrolase family protein [Moraxellaceae bacterium]
MDNPGLAAVQLCSGADLEANLAMARRQLEAAAAAGAQLAVLPENWAIFDAAQYVSMGRRLPELLERVGRMARELDLWIVAGTLPAAFRPDGSPVPDGRVRTACHVIDSDGEVVARYDKIHLFDVEIGDAQGSYRESATFEPGDRLVCVQTPVGRVGLSVCYDLRFPELYRALFEQGAEILVVPAAFTQLTGEAHWQPLLRARAIENQCYVIGSAQGGRHGPTRVTWGHSQIIDPWGRIVAGCGGVSPALVTAVRDPGEQARLRRDMPVASHRRL